MWTQLKQPFLQRRNVTLLTSGIAGFVLALRWAGGLQFLELTALDNFFRWRLPEPVESRVVIVAIEEADIQEQGEWPIPDRAIAQLLDKIKTANPSAIGLDLIRDLPVEPGREELNEVFASTPNLFGIEKVLGGAYGATIAPPPALEEQNRVGAIDLLLDRDGKVRRGLLAVTLDDGQTKESLAARLALKYLEDRGIEQEVVDGEAGQVKLGKALFSPLNANDGGYVRIDPRGYQLLLNFRRRGCEREPCSRFPTVSMSEVLGDRLPADFLAETGGKGFEGRIVLIGSTAPSLQDRFFTVYENPLAGVEIHGELTDLILSAALDGRPLMQMWSEPLEVLWIVVWSGMGATSIWVLRRMRWKLASFVLLGSGLAVGSYGAFQAGWWLPVVPGLMGFVGSGIAIAGYQLYLEQKERQTMMNLLGQQISPKIAQQVWRDREQLLKEGQILGQKMVVTVLFSDLKGFTTITENIDPETLMLWLNDYMKAMSQIVLDCDGTIDKFIGDAIMGVFGVPIPRDTEEEIAQDAQNAVRCAVEMAEKLKHLNREWHQKGFPTTSMRIGIATGVVVAGSLGSQQRLNYTIIGDSANVAARLESFDKSLDGGICRILISESTRDRVKEQFPTKLIGLAQLKGRKQPINVYQVPIKS